MELRLLELELIYVALYCSLGNPLAIPPRGTLALAAGRLPRRLRASRSGAGVADPIRRLAPSRSRLSINKRHSFRLLSS
ncbi:hypothetical protein GUJ93_ZPchr0006g41782 [Zizania palustris]|uniref:Uncharacterized protein n=1 Tax=Zizania palustris TaxID=103762 RepID=A0A8J5SJT7_ZIZPA|nr:hypothetical protein GUJ93_ZPchr0006g41782 [Zizania palustris]